MSREKVLSYLRSGETVSGEELSRALGLSRTAVWKAVESLRKEGHPIVSHPRRGHCLASGGDVLSEAGIRRYLTHPGLQVRFFPVITSTNTVLKQMALENAPAGLALVAESQTGGVSPGAMQGFEIFQTQIDPEKCAKEAALQARTMLHAPQCPAGVMPVVID
ncbi:MAG: HTH domain-containing protein, partial [Oscillibacter sp.]|nr:HTH domain-containing protein [Oscillibacter sp.]